MVIKESYTSINYTLIIASALIYGLFAIFLKMKVKKLIIFSFILNIIHIISFILY